jgi:hypothetical protein
MGFATAFGGLPFLNKRIPVPAVRAPAHPFKGLPSAGFTPEYGFILVFHVSLFQLLPKCANIS